MDISSAEGKFSIEIERIKDGTRRYGFMRLQLI